MSTAAIQGLQFRVRHPDGRTETLVVDSDRALIGSGAHCEIRVPAEHAAVEHVAITQVGGGVHAEARALDRLPTLGGVGFTQTPLPPESEIGVGAVVIGISVVTIEDNPNVIKKKAEKTSPMTYVLAILAIPLAIFVFTLDEDGGPPPTQPKEVTPLWEAKVDACPAQAPDQAVAMAIEKRVLAESKRERRPFHVQDGVEAVPLYETAAVCFKVGGEIEASAEAQATADDLRTQVAADYRAHQVRLEHSISVGDDKAAGQEVRVLRAFTDGKSGPYVTWLSNLDRQLQLKAAKKKS